MSENFEQALVLMGAGMGTVFFFLVVMVAAMYLSAYLLRNSHKEEPPTGKPSASGQGNLAEIAVAIAAAKHRNS